MFLKSLAVAIGLTSVFGVASAAGLMEPRCRTIVDTQVGQTQCTYLKPAPAVVGKMSGWVEFTKPVTGTQASACDAHFKEMQKKFGACIMMPRWGE